MAADATKPKIHRLRRIFYAVSPRRLGNLEAPGKSRSGVRHTMMQFFKLAAYALLLAGAGLVAAATSPEASRTARAKLIRVASKQLRAGETVTLTEDEINSFFRYDPELDIPEGVRDLEVTLEDNRCEVRARVDMSKMQSSGGGDPGLLVRMLLSGERVVRATCRYTSGQGEGLVDLESVEIDGTRISGRVLDWLISSYVAPWIPEFEPGKPMPLPHNLREIRLESGRAVLTSY